MFAGMSFMPRNAEAGDKYYVFDHGQSSDTGIFYWNNAFFWDGFGVPGEGDTVHIFAHRLTDVTVIYDNTRDYSWFFRLTGR
jgi:hypothetical protein